MAAARLHGSRRNVDADQPGGQRGARHGDDEAGWYLLYLDEDEGASETYTFGDGDGAVTTVSRTWDIIAHAKTSAKMYGVDDLNASARRLLYVSARKRQSREIRTRRTPREWRTRGATSSRRWWRG